MAKSKQRKPQYWPNLYYSDKKKLKLYHNFKFKIDGKRQIPIDSAKYLEVLLDEQMSWNEQIFQIKLKLNHSVDILDKLRSHMNLNTFKKSRNKEKMQKLQNHTSDKN